MRAADWLSIGDALETILAHVEPLASRPVPLEEALGRTLAAPVISPVSQPPWDNSAMDGFAAHGADVRDASEREPVVLRVIDTVHAGGFPSRPVGRGEATRIMTGAPVPQGIDSVIRVEHTRVNDDDAVAVLNGADAGRNIRLRGEDLQAGESVFAGGRVLRPAEIGVLAMIGCSSPTVYDCPRVAVLATGDELVEPGRVADVVAGTHIINSNSPALGAALRATSCVPVQLGIARDELDDLRERLGGAPGCDALITTAGASVGEHDLVKEALEAVGCETLFWRVLIRPGSPFSFGIIRRPGERSLPVFGLPGNPVSALVTFEILVRPALRRMQGRALLHSRAITVVAGEEIRAPAGLVRLLRVRLEADPAGPPRAYLTGPQGSGILTSVAAADALLVVPMDVAQLPAGATAQAVLLDGGDSAQESPP
jgi:molybdopterin molybdotransferase